MRGDSARTSSRCRNWISRQRLRPGDQAVSPGGNGFGGRQQAFSQQGDEQFSMNPGSATSIRPFRQVPQAHERLEALERQLNLPARPAKFHDLLGGQHFCRHGGPDEHVRRSTQRRGRQGYLFAARLATQAALRCAGRLPAAFDRHQPPSAHLWPEMDPRRPFADLADTERAQPRQDRQLPLGRAAKRQPVEGNAHENVGPRSPHVGDSRCGELSPGATGGRRGAGRCVARGRSVIRLGPTRSRSGLGSAGEPPAATGWGGRPARRLWCENPFSHPQKDRWCENPLSHPQRRETLPAACRGTRIPAIRRARKDSRTSIVTRGRVGSAGEPPAVTRGIGRRTPATAGRLRSGATGRRPAIRRPHSYRRSSSHARTTGYTFSLATGAASSSP